MKKLHPIIKPWVTFWVFTGLSVFIIFTTFPVPAQSLPPVIDGDKVDRPEKWPWMAALVGNNQSAKESGAFCGGTLIAPNRVLTAAHCVATKGPDDLDVIFGSVHPGHVRGEQRVDVAGITMHSRSAWISGVMTYDIAVLRLARSVLIKPLPQLRLATLGQEAKWTPGTQTKVLGYGMSENPTPEKPSPPANEVLREGTGKIVSGNLCRAMLQTIPNSNDDTDFDPHVMICALSDSEAGTGKKQLTCFGDSGGPLLVKDSSGGYTQVGVTSWVPDPLDPERSQPDSCNPLQPSVHAYIPSLHPFITTPDQILIDKPFSTSPPKVVGEPRVGRTLTCSPGTWGGDTAELSYQWYRRKVTAQGTQTSAITGATAHTYRVKTEDFEYRLSCNVTAKNSGGSQSETSEFTPNEIAL